MCGIEKTYNNFDKNQKLKQKLIHYRLNTKEGYIALIIGNSFNNITLYYFGNY